MNILLTVVAVTLAISAFCSLLEATLYSTRIPTLEAARSDPRHRARAVRFLALKHDIAGPTSAILILNTVANTAGATLAGWLAASAYGPGFVPVFSGLLTLGILFFSEIFPKTYGATKWKSLWPWLAYPLATLVKLLRPAVWLAERFTRLLTPAQGLPAVTEDEIRASIRMGARSGELTADELRILDAVFHFDDTTVREVLVPRMEVAFCDLDAPPSEFAETLRRSPFTRYPACRGGLDNVVGMLHARDLAGRAVDGDIDLNALVREVLTVPGTLRLSQLLKQMQSKRRQMAVVVDEHGSVSGMVTMTEILEQIVGSLEDELEEPAPQPVVRETDGSFSVRGNVALTRLNRELGVDFYDPTIVTLSGMIVSRLGRLVREGDVVELGGATAEVIETSDNRATRIRLRLPQTHGQPHPQDVEGEETDAAAEGSGEEQGER
jgi:CBS domain containing-hemolysin-like protein